MVQQPQLTDPTQWTADATTRDGLQLRIRAATGADKPILTELFEGVSAEDIDHRFFDQAGSATDLIAALSDGSPSAITFLAFANERLVACATLTDEEDGQSADVALSVRADSKKQGISWTLLDHVLRYAAAHGLREVTSVEPGGNQAAINLEREMGFVARLSFASPPEIRLSKRVVD